VSDPRHNSGSQSAEPGAERPRRRWLRLAIAGFLALLVVGVALAGSPDSGTRAALRKTQSVSKARGGLLAPPDFQFIGQGQIVGGAGMSWLISGVAIELDDHTQIVGDLGAGDFVVLSGRILSNGAWLADHIERNDAKDTYFTFNGPLVAMSQGTWKIGDRSLVVDARTELESGLALNDPVLVTFAPQGDGSWLALKVEYFDEPWIEPTPTPTETLAPAAEPAPAVITAPKKNKKPPAKPKSGGGDKEKNKHDGGKGRGKGRGRGH
jgi:Domain of unknown function (DUF5666)